MWSGDQPNSSFAMEGMGSLGTFGIIRQAVSIGIRNPSFIPLATLVSFPLFCSTLVHELLLQHILMEASSSPQPRNLPFTVSRLTHMTSGSYLLVAIVNIILIQLLNLLTAVTTVYSASAIHAGARHLALQDLLRNSFAKTRWKGPLLTYIYTFLLSNISSMVIVFFIIPILVSRNMLLLLVLVMDVIIALGIWLLMSAWWNMGVVISILEEKSGLEALSTSQYLSKGNRFRGFALMLLNFIWVYALSWSTLHARGSFSGRLGLAFVNTGLACAGKAMKWVVCMVYYHDCKRRCRDKDDIEEGTEDELLCEGSS